MRILVPGRRASQRFTRASEQVRKSRKIARLDCQSLPMHYFACCSLALDPATPLDFKNISTPSETEPLCDSGVDYHAVFASCSSASPLAACSHYHHRGVVGSFGRSGPSPICFLQVSYLPA